MKKRFASLLVPFLLWAQPAAAAVPLKVLEVKGIVQQWSPGSQTIMVTGKSYPMADSVLFMDGAAKPVSRSALRSGARVMLLLADDKATHVIINPAETSPFDQPKK